MAERPRARYWHLVPICLLVASCATRSPGRTPGGAIAHGTSTCDRTVLNVVFISQASEHERARIRDSARRLGEVLSSGEFDAACRARAMNRTGGRSVAAVCRHVACAGAHDLKVSLYHDPGMPTLAFEKRGAVFLNAAKARAGTPSNLAHEFAHVLGYTHLTWWEWWREDSVPYALAEVVETLDGAARAAAATGDGE